MARSATVRLFKIELSDVDHGVYESLSFRIAQHPSESPGYLVTRVLAYALHHFEGATFSRAGLCDGDEPPVLVDDPTGRRLLWVDIGLPAPERLHNASKAADRVTVYVHKAPEPWLTRCRNAKIHRKGDIDVVLLAPAIVKTLGESLERQNVWTVVAQDGAVFLVVDDAHHDMPLTRVSLDV